MPAAGRTALYRAFDVDDALLYVGITDGIDVRFKAHQKQSEWWPLMVRRDIEWFDTRRAALRAEATAISDENPRFNKASGYIEYEPYWLPRDIAKLVPDEKVRKAVVRRRKAAEAARIRLEESVREARKIGTSLFDLANLSGLSLQVVRKLTATQADARSE